MEIKKVLHLAQRIVSCRRGRSCTSDGFGRCRYVCRQVLKRLTRLGVACHVVRCTRPRIPHPVVGATWSPYIFHAVIVATHGSWVIDPTACNINYSHPRVRIMSLVELQAEWLYYRKWESV